MGLDKELKIINYGFISYWDNLYTCFGTNKPLRMLSPSLRTLPLTGLEWSFYQQDEGYDVDGERPRYNDIEMSAVAKKKKKKQPKQ